MIHSQSNDCAPAVRPSLHASYRGVDLPFVVRSPSRYIAESVDYVYGAMRSDEPPAATEGGVEIDIIPSLSDPSVLQVLFDGNLAFEAGGLGDLLHHLDNELTIRIETSLPRYYFVHAAALARTGRVTMLVGESGAGKSTTAYALAAGGWSYLSDELAPIDPERGLVAPYPRALCLKSEPPAPLSLPKGHLRTEWTFHVCPELLTPHTVTEALHLERIVFVRYSPAHEKPSLRPIPKGEATLRLYQGALNQLAHPSLGLDETVRLVRQAACFELLSAGIRETVAALE